MGIRIKVVAAIAGALAVVALAPGIAAAKLVVADYRFDNSLTSSIEGPGSLMNVGGGNDFATETVRGESDRVLTFPEGNGLSLVDPGLIPSDNYSVVLAFRFADLDDYDRILNTNGGPEPDYGLYSLTSGYLNFYDEDSDHAGNSAVIQVDEYVEVGFTRDPGKRLAGYANGVRQFTYTDAGPDDARIGAGGLEFFVDNGSEEAPGAVARIRVFNRALTPEQVQQVFEGCTVPKVKGKKKQAAKKKLKKAGCSVGKTKKKFSDKVETGRVIKQKPKKGTERDFEFGVKLTISKGPGG